MPGYLTKQETIAIAGVADLQMRSLLDRQQFADPQGLALRLGISSATWPLFGLLWPSGAHLAARLALRPVRAAERILEIGCGLALASLVGHRRGADITASDCHPLAAAFLLENLRLNQLLPMKYRHGHWGAPEQERPLDHPHDPPQNPQDRPDALVQGRFDLIIGSDLLYERDTAGMLAGFIAAHAEAVAEVWIVDPDRGNRPAFNRQMAALGFDRQELALRHALPVGAGTPLVYKGRMLVYRRGPAAPVLPAGGSLAH